MSSLLISSSSPRLDWSLLRNGNSRSGMDSPTRCLVLSVSAARPGFAWETAAYILGLFYAGYGAILTPAFGVAQAYGGTSSPEYNNAVGFFMILWTVFVFTFLIASLPSNVAYILVFLFVDLGFLTVAASYFAMADGNAAASVALKKSGGVFCFLAGLIGWYIVFHLMLLESLVDLPLGDTSRLFGKKKQKQ